MANKSGVCKLDGCDKYGPLTTGLCHMHYRRKRLTGSVRGSAQERVPNNPTEKQLLDYWGWDIDPVTGCWIARGWRNEDGYIVYSRSGYKETAHRVSFRHHHGPIPEGEEIRHKCDVRSCINPAHLESGTHRDNILDVYRRNRSSKAKLTLEKVQAIRKMREEGALMQTIADEFGVSRTLVGRVLSGKSWSWVS